MAQLSRALAVALEAAAAAREILLAECARPDGPRGEIGHCPADDEAEWAIRRHLLEAFPTWGFLGEETGAKDAADGQAYVWVVDPNDGTTSMQRGYRGHAVSIGLVRRGVPVLGVVWAVDAPDDLGDLIVWAEECGPIQRNGVSVARVRWQPRLGEQDVVALSQGANRNPVGYGACIEPARFVGTPSIAYRLALVAVGECVATVSLNYLSVWDYAAGHALVRGAGGSLVDEHGVEITYGADGRGEATRIFCAGPETVMELVRRPWRAAPGSGFGAAIPPPGLAPARAQVGRLVHATSTLRRAQGCLLGQIAGGPRLLADGGPHRILAGQPTDDSELALMLARSLLTHGRFDQEDVAEMYARWYHGWTHTDVPEPCAHPWCRPFDSDSTTSQALQAISLDDTRTGRAAERATSAANRTSQANGALMRVSPLGIWGARRRPSEVAEAARLDAQLTHPHAICQDASAVFAVSLAAAIGEGLDARQLHALALDWGRATHIQPAVIDALQQAQESPPADFNTRQGWVLIALGNAYFQLLHAPSLEEGVVATVRAGGDTDTNAAICAALLGAVHGRDAIPERWQRMVLSCRPLAGQPGVDQPRPALFWATDALVLAERLVESAVD